MKVKNTGKFGSGADPSVSLFFPRTPCLVASHSAMALLWQAVDRLEAEDARYDCRIGE